MAKLTLQDLQSVFSTPRGDHPGRRGGQVPRRGSGHKRRRDGKSVSPLRALKRFRA